MRFVTWLWDNAITTTWGRVPNGILSMMFTCCPNSMFLASLWLKIYRFSNWLFFWLWEVQSFILLTYSKLELILFVPFYYFGQVTVIILGLGNLCCKKQSKASPFDKNSRTTHKMWHKLFSMIQSVGIKNWFPQPINGL